MTELNTLKMKAPSDLWKEDLAAFTEELEVIEMISVCFLHLMDLLFKLMLCV